MALPKYHPSQPIAPPARGVKASTFKLLVDTAMDLIRQDGHIPTVAEVAVRSRVSRATAYRYFASRSALVTTVIDASLGPVRSVDLENSDGRERVRELFELTFPRFAEFEPQLRAALQLALEQWALERAGLLEEEPYRRGHRVQILARATQPLADVLPPAVLERLRMALSVVYGIEPYVVFKDIWGLRQPQVEQMALWMADALIDAALRDARQIASSKKPATPTKRRPAHSRRTA
jgi:AcrR family transcriptional regulator